MYKSCPIDGTSGSEKSRALVLTDCQRLKRSVANGPPYLFVVMLKGKIILLYHYSMTPSSPLNCALWDMILLKSGICALSLEAGKYKYFAVLVTVHRML